MNTQDVTLPPALEVDVLRGHITREYAVELVRLRNEVKKAWWEGYETDGEKRLPWENSRAKRVMEGRE